MIKPHTKWVRLSPITKEDFTILLHWRNSEYLQGMCSVRDKPLDLKEFSHELEEDFLNDRHEQYLIIRQYDDQPVGTIYSYNLNIVDEHCFVTVIVDEKHMGLGYGVHAVMLMVAHLFQAFGLFKVYLDVYSNNSSSLGNLYKWGLVQEGMFTGHRIKQGQRTDLLRFAIYDTELNRIKSNILRMGGSE
jgi:RimJ/RimL family protein N-acetyltransferase